MGEYATHSHAGNLHRTQLHMQEIAQDAAAENEGSAHRAAGLNRLHLRVAGKQLRFRGVLIPHFIVVEVIYAIMAVNITPKQ